MVLTDYDEVNRNYNKEELTIIWNSKKGGMTMSKAEKFIQDYTRDCSNEMTFEDGGGSHNYVPWLTPDQTRKAVEIAKEEVIEKVYEFLENDLCCYIKAQDFTIEHQRLENDLKQAMKDE